MSETGSFSALLAATVAMTSCGPLTIVGSSDGSVDLAAGNGGSCSSCVSIHCAAQEQTCGADPACAAWLACVRACSPSDGGDADPGCAAACPPVTGPAADTAALLLQDCRYSGAGAGCTGCFHEPPDGGAASGLLHQSCHASSNTNACFKCIEERCCETYGALMHDVPGNALWNCIAMDCPDQDPACFKTCYMAHPRGLAAVVRMDTCLNPLCAASCGGVPEPAACLQCAFDHCLDAWAACEADTECYLFSVDVMLCTDAACVGRAQKSHPGSLAPYEAVHGCLAHQCPMECDGYL